MSLEPECCSTVPDAARRSPCECGDLPSFIVQLEHCWHRGRGVGGRFVQMDTPGHKWEKRRCAIIRFLSSRRHTVNDIMDPELLVSINILISWLGVFIRENAYAYLGKEWGLRVGGWLIWMINIFWSSANCSEMDSLQWGRKAVPFSKGLQRSTLRLQEVSSGGASRVAALKWKLLCALNSPPVVNEHLEGVFMALSMCLWRYQKW